MPFVIGQEKIKRRADRNKSITQVWPAYEKDK
jgi:hypothetical protein